MKNKLFLIGFILLFIFTGCSSPPKETSSSMPMDSGSYSNEDIAIQDRAMSEEGADSSLLEDQKLIKQGDISLEVQDVKEAYIDITEIIKAYNGYVFSMSETNYENQSYMNITIKVDSEEFENLFEQLKTMGELNSSNIYTQDVTREYIDTRARLDTLKIQEQTLQNLLTRAETVEDLLKIETELQRVRQDIEASQGQLNYLENAIDYSVINLNLRSRRGPSTLDQRDNILERLLFSLRDGIGFWANFIVSAAAFVLWLLPVLIVAVFLVKPLKKLLTKLFRKRGDREP